MKELMIHVERIVRPIHGDGSKLRMRRELLAHLQAAYDQERAAGRDHEAALLEAKHRLGDPATLTSELQATIPLIERIGTMPFPRWLSWTCWIAALLSLLVVDALIVLPVVPIRARAISTAGMLLVEMSFVCWFLCAIPLFSRQIRWKRVVVNGLVASACQLAGFILMEYALSGRIMPNGPMDALAAQLIIPAFCLFPPLMQKISTRSLRPWLELEIAE